MFDLTILEVAIGMVFVYLLLSLVASGISEIVAQTLGLRSANLSKWIIQMFDSKAKSDEEKKKAAEWAEKFYGLGRIKSLTAPGPGNPISWLIPLLRRVGGTNKPSYIKASTFASAMIDLAAPPTGNSRSLTFADMKSSLDPAMPPPAGTSAPADELPDEAKKLLLSLISDAGDLDEARKSIEQWFDDAMERVSGSYKRQAQLILLGIGVALALVVNVNSFEIAGSLWRDDTLRASVVVAAEERAASEFGDGSGSADMETSDAEASSGQATAVSASQVEETDAENDKPNPYEDVADDIASLNASDIPIGWDDPPNSATGIFAMLVGIAFTGLAVSLGAPFWFDALNKLVNVRGSVKPKTSKEEGA